MIDIIEKESVAVVILNPSTKEERDLMEQIKHLKRKQDVREIEWSTKPKEKDDFIDADKWEGENPFMVDPFESEETNEQMSLFGTNEDNKGDKNKWVIG